MYILFAALEDSQIIARFHAKQWQLLSRPLHSLFEQILSLHSEWSQNWQNSCLVASLQNEPRQTWAAQEQKHHRTAAVTVLLSRTESKRFTPHLHLNCSMTEDALKLVYRPLNCSFIFSWKPEECKHENHLADALIQSEQHKKELLQLTPDAGEHNTLDWAT